MSCCRKSHILKYLKLLFSVVILIFVLLGIGSSYYGISSTKYVEQTARILGATVTYHLYKDDLILAEKMAKKHRAGALNPSYPDPALSWARYSDENEGLIFGSYKGVRTTDLEVPFIFENYEADYLKTIRDTYNIESLLEDHETNEYENMLRVSAWVGSQWDHGTDAVPGGSKRFRFIDAVESAKNGSAFWCEVSARALSQVAASLGWPSRVLSLSSTGYEWEHAVTELWSNQFAKWFVVDTDFNIVYESNGIPLSAYELIHNGAALRESENIEIRQIASMKPFFLARYGESKELSILRELNVYRYGHIDMRNDWVSRSLRPGSPAGGDLATYYTVNESLGPIYNAYHHVISEREFNWPINTVDIFLNEWNIESKQVNLNVDISAYAPYMEYIEMQINGDRWVRIKEGNQLLSLTSGKYALNFRVKSKNSMPGPITKLMFTVMVN